MVRSFLPPVSRNLVTGNSRKLNFQHFVFFWKITSSRNGLRSFLLRRSSRTKASIFDANIFQQPSQQHNNNENSPPAPPHPTPPIENPYLATLRTIPDDYGPFLVIRLTLVTWLPWNGTSLWPMLSLVGSLWRGGMKGRSMGGSPKHKYAYYIWTYWRGSTKRRKWGACRPPQTPPDLRGGGPPPHPPQYVGLRPPAFRIFNGRSRILNGNAH